MTILIPIFGDQLSHGLSSLAGQDKKASVILMAEVDEETEYVPHHKSKMAYILSAMRHHAEDLRAAGWTVDYVKLSDANNSGSLTGEVARAIERHKISALRVTEAGEWRVKSMLDSWPDRFDIPVTILPDDRFLCTHDEFESWAKDRKQLRMEFFYRDMRRKSGFLMDGDVPEGGQWNFDAENRKPAKRDLTMPKPLHFPPNAVTQQVIQMVEDRYGDNIGQTDTFGFAVTRADALRQQQHFLAYALPYFGDYQDAMLTDEPFLWHSILSPYINSGLLDPLELCRAVEVEYRAGKVPINAAEGFIRQVIGWREYVRGIYWHAGPEYVESNALDATRSLPTFYWTGKTDMLCLSQAIDQTIAHSYAHHIQRLMITGNFALLAGLDPKQVHTWYLAVYADAYEWVELPNSLGMSQFADGGMLASKPYAASGAYINRMSDYCTHCRYDVKQRVGPKACPFNALYWEFITRNEGKLRKNPRMAMPYKNWDRMADADKVKLRTHAQQFLETLG
ncbi:MAG: cryptochrome/photolyase family protein [Sphingorhabdus sp.]|nr:cryptochrome/photolyase family protein [Sphingorhabdus sp.]